MSTIPWKRREIERDSRKRKIKGKEFSRVRKALPQAYSTPEPTEIASNLNQADTSLNSIKDILKKCNLKPGEVFTDERCGVQNYDGITCTSPRHQKIDGLCVPDKEEYKLNLLKPVPINCRLKRYDDSDNKCHHCRDGTCARGRKCYHHVDGLTCADLGIFKPRHVQQQQYQGASKSLGNIMQRCFASHPQQTPHCFSSASMIKQAASPTCP